MPGSYTIDAIRRIVFSRAWGVLVDADLIAHAKALRDDPRFSPDFSQIADFRQVAEYRLTAETVRGHVHVNPFSPAARRVIAVAPGVGFGMARMYQATLAGDSDAFQVVHSLEDANEWMGLDRASPWPEGPADAAFGIEQAHTSP